MQMNDENVVGIHWSFWAISVIALIWNAMGAMNLFMQMDADMVATFPESHRAIIEGRPLWATGGFAIAVFAGALGGLLLLLRKSAAFYLFIISLIGVVVSMIHTINIASSVISFNIVEIIIMILMPAVVAAILIWYAKQATNKGWIS